MMCRSYLRWAQSSHAGHCMTPPLHGYRKTPFPLSHTRASFPDLCAVQSMHAELAEGAAGHLLDCQEQLGISDVTCFAAGDDGGTDPYFLSKCRSLSME